MRTIRPPRLRAVVSQLILLVGLSMPDVALAFPHIVQAGESLAELAGRYYGDAKREIVLVGGNALDVQGGSVIRPGMRIEVPAPLYVRARKGDTWYTLARQWLGDERRAELLATHNHGEAWVPPAPGKELVVPAVISHICAEGDTIHSIWQRYGLPSGLAWKLKNYNFHEGIYTKRGDILLVPLPDLRLSDQGKLLAQAAADMLRSEGAGGAHTVQQRADEMLPQLEDDVVQGRYVEVVAKGQELLARGALVAEQKGRIHRALLEAYVALGASALAQDSCTAYREWAVAPSFDPVWVSPKIRAACGMP